MSAGNTNKMMAMAIKFQHGESLFKNHKDLCNTIDASKLGEVPWKSTPLGYQAKILDSQVPEWMTVKYELFYCNPRDVIGNMISDTTFKFVFDYIPYQDFDEDGDRQYGNLMSRDWAFHQAVCFVQYLHLSVDAIASTGHHHRG